MTTSTLSLKQGLDAAPAMPEAGRAAMSSAVRPDRRGQRATRRLGVALLAGVVAAVMVAASSLLAGEGQTDGALTWLALWIVGFAALLIFARAAFAAAGMLQTRWALHCRNAAWLREQRAMARAAKYDPRLAHELQIMRDRATWHQG